jgi:hypothetical protein
MGFGASGLSGDGVLISPDISGHCAAVVYYFSTSAKNCFMASQERRSACSLYALPLELSLPASQSVKE